MFDFNFKIIIPVKGNSERVKSKNALPFGDKPTMLEWKISQLLEVFKPSDIVISTDFEPFKDIARKNGCLLHERTTEECNDNKISANDAIYGILKDISVEHFAWIPVTSPLMNSNEYQKCFIEYEKNVINGSFDSLFSCQLYKEYFWNEISPINYTLEKHIISQNLPNWYRVTNGFYMVPQSIAYKNKYFLGTNPYKVEVSKLAGLDIDYPEDYEIAKALYPLYLQKNNSLR
jgi:CMP-N-acetylneuraminic acid synthetase